MLNRLFVFKGRAYRSQEELEANEHVSSDKAERLPFWGLIPKFIYRITGRGFSRLAVDPEDVRHALKGHEDADVEVIPVR
ncbi:MAG: hypothetical protein HXY22_11220 [Alphaproteobacteria bacterium]|nr:hypothetical protein [Alphaproteobacteria bacterium]